MLSVVTTIEEVLFYGCWEIGNISGDNERIEWSLGMECLSGLESWRQTFGVDS